MPASQHEAMARVLAHRLGRKLLSELASALADPSSAAWLYGAIEGELDEQSRDDANAGSDDCARCGAKPNRPDVFCADAHGCGKWRAHQAEYGMTEDIRPLGTSCVVCDAGLDDGQRAKSNPRICKACELKRVCGVHPVFSDDTGNKAG